MTAIVTLHGREVNRVWETWKNLQANGRARQQLILQLFQSKLEYAMIPKIRTLF
jgi:hypothetical protein